uniref:Uncharacterized protein n=1 Tax=Parascaris equorum TaxID=6256 RepID=A0A914RHC3_PAREQ
MCSGFRDNPITEIKVQEHAMNDDPASFIVSFISFTSFLFVTVFFIYAGYWYALPVLIVGSVGWIVCLRLPIGISGHLNPCYADMIQIGEQNRSSYGSPPSYDALAFGMPVVPPAYTSDETSLPSYSATVSSSHTGNTNAADSILSTSRNDQMPKTDVLVEGQK